MDSMLEETGFSMERYVQPFGNYELLQCDRGCTKELKDAGEMKENVLIHHIPPCIFLISLHILSLFFYLANSIPPFFYILHKICIGNKRSHNRLLLFLWCCIKNQREKFPV